MSRNSKNARNHERARQMTAMRKNGNKGPAKTTPKHGKRVTYRTNPDTQKRIAEALKASSLAESKSTRTSGRKLLESAGKAAQE